VKCSLLGAESSQMIEVHCGKTAARMHPDDRPPFRVVKIPKRGLAQGLPCSKSIHVWLDTTGVCSERPFPSGPMNRLHKGVVMTETWRCSAWGCCLASRLAHQLALAGSDQLGGNLAPSTLEARVGTRQTMVLAPPATLRSDFHPELRDTHSAEPAAQFRLAKEAVRSIPALCPDG
jgi:hypothetical protein